MKHYILYYHGGSGNHGCEALVRTTAELLNYKKNRITLASFRPIEDIRYGVDHFCDIHKMYESKNVSRFNFNWIRAYAQLKLKHNYWLLDDLPLLNAVGAKKGDVALSIGGDNYCYNDNYGLRNANELWRRNGIKTVLWGCSIDPELLDDPKVANDIATFDLVTARESISYEAIKNVNKNTVLVSDSALSLNKTIEPLPSKFTNTDIVGLNLSPLAANCEKTKGITKDNYINLIKYILTATKMNVLLIPHVIWNHDDDRTINKEIIEEFMPSERVKYIDDMNCTLLKGYISRCRFFVGARTHASIAAYSSCVPTVALGYSTKAKGIAKDIFGTYDNYVVPVQSLSTSFDLVNSFIWIQRNEKKVKEQLTQVIPKYITNVYKGIDALKKL